MRKFHAIYATLRMTSSDISREKMDRYSRRMAALRSHHKKCEERYKAKMRTETYDNNLQNGEQSNDKGEVPTENGSAEKSDIDTENGSAEKSDIDTENGSAEKSDIDTENETSKQDSSESETCSEYVPSDKESTADELDSERESGVQLNTIDTLIPSDKDSLHTSKKKKKMTIKTTVNCPKGTRKWNKKQYCLYCQKPQSKISRHLENRHANEPEVSKAFSFPKHSKKRKDLLEGIRNKGNYFHNVEVLENKDGEIVTWRQPTVAADISDFLPCPQCLGFFMKKDLWKHSKACRAENVVKRKKGERVRSTAACLLPMGSDTPAGIRTLLMGMREDSIAKAITEDRLIMLFGESIYTKCGHDRAQHPYIVQKMRELARFMVKVKELSKSVETLEKLCVPQNFVLAITACKEVSSYNAESNLFKTPSLALKIGYSLKKACQVSLGQSLMSGDTETERNVKNFIKLIDSHWRTNISSKALNTLQQARWNKGDTIPLTADVMALQKHLRKQEEVSKEKLRKNANAADWKVLAETILCQIILFNRRREGEASKLLLTVYEKRNVKPANQDVVKSLTKLEQQLCSELTRLEIRGKRGKKVPVLLTKDMVDSLDLLIGSREKVGVTKDNPYVFAKVECSAHIRGSDCLRKYAAVCGAKDPKSLTSTQLRKQVATLCQIMNLKDNELDQLAKFMGHDIRVHREYYRLSENTIQLAKVSKLLLSLEKGSGVYKGRSLEEIQFSTDVTGEELSQTTDMDEEEHTSASRKSISHSSQHKRQSSDTDEKEHTSSRKSISKSSKRKRQSSDTDEKEHTSSRKSISKSSKRKRQSSDTAVKVLTEVEEEHTSASRKSVSKSSKRKRQSSDTDEKEHTSASRKSVSHSSQCKRQSSDTDEKEHTSSRKSISKSSKRKRQSSDTDEKEHTSSRKSISKSSKRKRQSSDTAVKVLTEVEEEHTSASRKSVSKSSKRKRQSSDTDEKEHTSSRKYVSKSSKRKRQSSDTDEKEHTSSRKSISKSSKRKRLSSDTAVKVLTEVEEEHTSASRKSVSKSAHKNRLLESVEFSEDESFMQPSIKSGKKAPKRPWSPEEQLAVKDTMRKFLALRKVPGMADCLSCLDKNPVLGSRSWRDIKNFVHNTIQSMKKKLATITY
nr:uncharacterized protein LOC101882062 isoform X6 [Danio rerio]XP_009293994.1 uncharacterized protein si:ch73-269m14.4 isoform X6 [Danio rerio]XP_021327068.1 uncharacterized protein LOC110437737 isoform X6 [Danio rerio]|eukprot:XP_005166371.2 uncharacterized protein LOC101882062 isoform X6 [Danio rerio]